MTRLIVTIAPLLLSACNLAAPSGGGSAPAAGAARAERLVLGSNMSFEQCQARGGLIIRDAGSPMVACDPRVQGPSVPADEFDHPPATRPAATGQG